MNALPEILDGALPLETALRAARDRGQVLQTNGRVSVLSARLLPGFAKIAGGPINERKEHYGRTP